MEFEIRARRAVSSDTLIETLSSFIAEKTPQPFGSPKKEAREGTQGYTGVPTVNEDVRYQLKTILENVRAERDTGSTAVQKRKPEDDAPSSPPQAKKPKANGVTSGQYSVCPSTDTPYLYQRIEGYCSEAHLKGTKPLNFFWHGRKQDNVLTTGQKVKPSNGGYTFVRVDCYVWEKQVEGLVPLDLYYHKKRKDHLAVASKEGREWAKANKYNFVGTQGYVYQPYAAEGQAGNDLLTANDLLSLQAGCTDLHPNCSKWAAEGECTANAHYMLYNCGLSCGVCSNADAAANGVAVDSQRSLGATASREAQQDRTKTTDKRTKTRGTQPRHRSSAWDFLRAEPSARNLSVQLRGRGEAVDYCSHSAAADASSNCTSMNSQPTVCPGLEGNYSFQRVEGYCSRVQLEGTLPLFFYFSRGGAGGAGAGGGKGGTDTNDHDHLVTTSSAIEDRYKFQRIECYVWRQPGPEGSALARTRLPLQLHYNAQANDHATLASDDSISWLKSGETTKDDKAGQQVYEFTALQGYVNSPEIGSFVMSEKPPANAQRESRKKKKKRKKNKKLKKSGKKGGGR
eukprot:g744.t1